MIRSTSSARMGAAAVAVTLVLAGLGATTVSAHGVSATDLAMIASGRQLVLFLYLGAKHMVTGYDHLLFLFGVIFFLYRLKDVTAYVSLFAIGHSLTLLYGVLGGTHLNSYLVDTVIGLSVVYKAFDNLGGFERLLGFQPNTKVAVLLFGLCHGFGLATKLQDFGLSRDGLVPNILAFNVGVETGQMVALTVILIAMGFWRRSHTFTRHAFVANVVLMTCGFILASYQLTGYLIG